MEGWKKLLADEYGHLGPIDVSPEYFVQAVIEEFDKYGFKVVLQSRCWCEGMNNGIEHSPFCDGIEHERLLGELNNGAVA